MDELTAEELDKAIEQEAEKAGRERQKRRVLALLEAVPAESVLWDRVLVLLEMQEGA